VNISRGSAAELTYLVGLAGELGYVPTSALEELIRRCARVCAQLQALLKQIELLLVEESRTSTPPKA
jgi:four helix bundle protein